MFREIDRIIQAGEPAVLVTVVETKGSVPRHPGSRMIVYPDKKILGTIGGGTLEIEVINDSIEIIKTKKPILKSYGLYPKDKNGIGMTCGGNVTVFIEPIVGQDRLLIVGAGHIAVPLAEISKKLDFHVTVVEDRDEFLTQERFPTVDKVECIPTKKIGEFIKKQKLQYVALINRNSACDADWLEVILKKNEALYVGCIGSKMRLRTVGEQLKQRGITNEQIERIYGPIGLEIGAETPAEIAISILSEIISLKRKQEKTVSK